MQDPTTDYAAAIEAVRNAHEAYNIAVQALSGAEEELERKTLAHVVNNVICVSYIAIGKNEAERRERRASWIYDILGRDQELVRTAKHEKAQAEMHLEHARNLRSLARLRCEWVMQGGGDLLGPEPPVGRLPVDPRWGDINTIDARGETR